MARARVLVADDDAASLRLMEFIMKAEGYDVVTAADGESALRLHRENACEAILSDLLMPRMGGMDLLKRLQEAGDEVPVIVITAFGSIDSAVEAMREGAFHYITKPFQKEELKLVVKRALERHQLVEENKRLQSELAGRYKFDSILGASKAMQEVFRMLSKVIETDVTVLIQGESGTGKELVARAVHFNGPRRKLPFVVVNCSAIPEALLESELFGHEKGAFTGATQKRLGKFEVADNGTLFLDEIGDMSLVLQAKVLRVLQSMEFQRVGGKDDIRVDVRIISATNRRLDEDVRDRRFREDLFYRLNVVPIMLPALRVRKEDVPELAAAFLERFRRQHGKEVGRLSSGVLDAFESYDWPGNVRELENAIERAVVTCEGNTVKRGDLPLEIRDSAGGSPVPEAPEGLSEAVEALEREMMTRALEDSGWVQTRAARKLGITERVLGYKARKFGIHRPS